jgi:hypothetical protein
MEIREHGNDILICMTPEDDKGEFALKVRELIQGREHHHSPRIFVSMESTAEEAIKRIDEMLAASEVPTLANVVLMDEMPKSVPFCLTAECRGDGWNYLSSRINYRSKDPSKGIDGMPRKRGKGR